MGHPSDHSNASMAPEADFRDFKALGKELLVALEAKSGALTLTMCRAFPEEAVPEPCPSWAPSLAHVGGHSSGAALPCAWGQLSPNFLRAGGRRKGNFSELL